MAKKRKPNNPNNDSVIETPAPAAEAPAAEAPASEPKTAKVTIESGGKKRSYSFPVGMTWGEFRQANGIKLAKGWMAMAGGNQVSDNYILEDGLTIRLGNKPRNGAW